MTIAPAHSAAAATDPPDWFLRAVAEQPQSATLDVDGHAIHYLRWGGDSGDGNSCEHGNAPVLLVHGNGGHARWWSFVAPFVAARGRQVVAIDLGGMGDSADPPQPGLDVFARQVAALAQSLADHLGGGSKVALVGHSFGGLVSAAATALRPDLFARLVVIDSPFHIGRRPEWRRTARNHGAVYRSEAEILSRFRLLPAQVVEPAAALDFIARHSIAPVPGGGWTWKFRIDPWESPAMPNTLWTTVGERIRHFPGPRAYLRGELSTLCPPEVEATWRDFAGPDAPLITIPHAHHHAILDQPLAVVAALETLFATT